MSNVSRTRTRMQHLSRKRARRPAPAPDFDQLLESLDICLQLEDHPGLHRTQRAMTCVENMGLQPTSRLAYLPQPSYVVDFSKRHLIADAVHIFGKSFVNDLVAPLLVDVTLRGQYIHFLSYLDAHAALAPSDRTKKMTDHFLVVSDLTVRISLQFQEPLWHPETPATRKLRIRRCSMFALFQRVWFYEMRAHGRSLESYNAAILELRDLFAIPADWDAQTELYPLTDEIAREGNAIVERFNEITEKEWAETPIPVEQISTPLPSDEAADSSCTICQDSVTPPGVRTNACNHPYCASCLRGWIHACEAASHRCPLCRTELFPRPEYKYKQPENAENYHQRLTGLRAEIDRIDATRRSLRCFEKEIELQMTFERETQTVEAP